MEEEKIETWALVELMGRTRVVGKVSESPFADVRVDVLSKQGEFDRTEHIGKSAIYRITEITKDVALRLAVMYAPEPSFAWNVRQLSPAPDDDYSDADDEPDETDED